MEPLISCLCPTFNRFPSYGHLVGEAVASFIKQDYPNKELILCNDQPLQKLSLRIDHPNVRVINLPERIPTFAKKIDYMISEAQGQYLCRWDDDDINLPHRLSYSMKKLDGKREWRSELHIYAPKNQPPLMDYTHGNTHLTSLWHRDILKEINNGFYPGQWPGGEDQMFNRLLVEAGYHSKGEMIPDEDVFYLYRWGVGLHWSGPGGDLQKVYDQKGEQLVEAGEFTVQPHWRTDYRAYVNAAIQNTPADKRPQC